MPILDLSKPKTNEEREPNVIDNNGQPHFFRDADSITYLEDQELTKLTDAVDAFATKKNASLYDQEQFNRKMVEVCKFILPTMDEQELANLEPGERRGLYLGFLGFRGTQSVAGQEAMKLADQMRRFTSSLDSNASTAGR